MSATARLRENAVLLHFAVKLLEGKLKGVTGINSDLTHRLPARSTITRSSSILSLVAIAAINRFVPPWLEGHLGLIATARTRCSIHLAWFAGTAIPALTFACSATRWTAAWSVCQPVTRVKFLFAYCKHKFLVAVSTNKGLITQCHVSFSIPGTKSQQIIVYCALCQQTVIHQRNSARYNARRVYHIQYPKSLIWRSICTWFGMISYSDGRVFSCSPAGACVLFVDLRIHDIHLIMKRITNNFSSWLNSDESFICTMDESP
jgi:hypothetical protein